jgi:hypothetical protein
MEKPSQSVILQGFEVVRPAGFEPVTFRVGGRGSECREAACQAGLDWVTDGVTPVLTPGFFFFG